MLYTESLASVRHTAGAVSQVMPPLLLPMPRPLPCCQPSTLLWTWASPTPEVIGEAVSSGVGVQVEADQIGDQKQKDKDRKYNFYLHP